MEYFPAGFCKNLSAPEAEVRGSQLGLVSLLCAPVQLTALADLASLPKGRCTPGTSAHLRSSTLYTVPYPLGSAFVSSGSAAMSLFLSARMAGAEVVLELGPEAHRPVKPWPRGSCGLGSSLSSCLLTGNRACVCHESGFSVVPLGPSVLPSHALPGIKSSSVDWLSPGSLTLTRGPSA